MSVNLSIKNVPEHLIQQLRRRAKKHHRSLQGELMAMIEQSLEAETVMTPHEVLKTIQLSGLKTPGESMEMIRELRSAR